LLFAYREVLQTKPAQKAVQGAKGGGLDFLKLPTVWMCFAFFFLTAMALGGVHSFAATALRELYGMSLNAATSAYSAFMLASAFGMFAGGVLAARGGKHDHTIAIAFVGSAVFALILATGAGNGALALALMAATGFCTGIAGPSRDLMIRAAAPQTPLAASTASCTPVWTAGWPSHRCCSVFSWASTWSHHCSSASPFSRYWPSPPPSTSATTPAPVNWQHKPDHRQSLLNTSAAPFPHFSAGIRPKCGFRHTNPAVVGRKSGSAKMTDAENGILFLAKAHRE
jgi:hypothetical protein